MIPSKFIIKILDLRRIMIQKALKGLNFKGNSCPGDMPPIDARFASCGTKFWQ